MTEQGNINVMCSSRTVFCAARDSTVQTPGELPVRFLSEDPEVWTLEYRVRWMMHRALSDDAQLDRLDQIPN